MNSYWIDANVLIEASNGLYSFDLAPPFWSFLDAQVFLGRIRSSIRIYAEILKYEAKEDQLAQWVKNRKTGGMFVTPDKDVQSAFSDIANYVAQKYAERPAKAAEFLSGGDGWIIAHAKCEKGTVVTHESRVDTLSMTPKIPNVCTHFEVRCIGLVEMLSALNFRFTA